MDKLLSKLDEVAEKNKDTANEVIGRLKGCSVLHLMLNSKQQPQPTQNQRLKQYVF